MKNLLIISLVVIGISGHSHFSSREPRPRTFYGYIEPKSCPFYCKEGTICMDGECVFPATRSFSESLKLFGSKKCSTDIDCGSSRICVDGKCVVNNGLGGLCSADSQCPKGFICIDGKCSGNRRRFSLPCVGECMPGQMCVNGVCKSIPMFQFH